MVTITREDTRIPIELVHFYGTSLPPLYLGTEAAREVEERWMAGESLADLHAEYSVRAHTEDEARQIGRSFLDAVESAHNAEREANR
jgi:hypothetical protein